MHTVDASVVQCRVYAFKEGLLSAVGHDVALSVDKLAVTIDGQQITATFDPSRLTVLYAMRNGEPNPSALSDKDKRTIEGYVREDILHSRRYPTLRFVSTSIATEDGSGDSVLIIEGALELHGRTKTIRARITREADRISSCVRLHQPDFGITPFRAMLGALRIQPNIEVRISLPSSALAGLWPSVT